MTYLRIIEDRWSGERFLQLTLPANVDDENVEAVMSFVRRFLAAWERQSNRVDAEICELERLYRADGA
jgi:hypothetical protein